MNLPLVADVMADQRRTSRSNPTAGHSTEFLSSADHHRDRHHIESNPNESDGSGEDIATNTPSDSNFRSITVRVRGVDIPPLEYTASRPVSFAFIPNLLCPLQYDSESDSDQGKSLFVISSLCITTIY